IPIMVALISEKSRLIRPGVMMMSLMPCTAWRSRSSATLKDWKKLVPLGTSFSKRSLGMAITLSTVPATPPRPSPALPIPPCPPHHDDPCDARAGSCFFLDFVLQIVHIHIAVDNAHGHLLTSTFSRSRLHFPFAARRVASTLRNTSRDPRRYTRPGRSFRAASPECLR